MVHRTKIVKEAGDTIVEVLIAIAIVSSILAIAYSITNRNILTTRDNQERTEASKYAQSQIELLKSSWDNNSQTNPATALPAGVGSSSFCLDDSDAIVTISSTQLTSFAYPGACISSGLYHKSITYNSDGGYLISVKWDSLYGKRDEIVMGYRLQ